MAGAHLMACDPKKDGVCFRGNDCDDLVILLASCLLSVGIYTMIVGHAYNREKHISHVLVAAWINGRWVYADPSTELPLGRCVEFTRERIYSVPNVQMLCDSNSCLVDPRRFQPEKSGFVAKGEFVGVNGPPPVVTFSWVVEPDRQVQWLGATDSFQVDPKLVEAAKNAQKGDWGAVGAGAGAAVCVASGAGAAVAPICAAVGNWLGQTFAGAFNAVEAGYQQQLAQQNAIDAAGDYLDELKKLRDEFAQKTVRELVLFGKQNGWSQANEVDVAVKLHELGANITNVSVDARTNKLPSNVLITSATLGEGGPYMSGPLPCSGSMPHYFLTCTGGSCGPGGKGQYVVNQAYMQCMTDKTNEWAGQLEIAATVLGMAILEHKAPGQIQFSPIFQMRPKPKKKSKLAPLALAAAGIGTVVWLLL